MMKPLPGKYLHEVSFQSEAFSKCFVHLEVNRVLVTVFEKKNEVKTPRHLISQILINFLTCCFLRCLLIKKKTDFCNLEQW